MARTDLKMFNRVLLQFLVSYMAIRVNEHGYGELARAAIRVRDLIPTMTDAEVEMALDQWPRLAPVEED